MGKAYLKPCESIISLKIGSPLPRNICIFSLNSCIQREDHICIFLSGCDSEITWCHFQASCLCWFWDWLNAPLSDMWPLSLTWNQLAQNVNTSHVLLIKLSNFHDKGSEQDGKWCKISTFSWQSGDMTLYRRWSWKTQMSVFKVWGGTIVVSQMMWKGMSTTWGRVSSTPVTKYIWLCINSHICVQYWIFHYLII